MIKFHSLSVTYPKKETLISTASTPTNDRATAKFLPSQGSLLVAESDFHGVNMLSLPYLLNRLVGPFFTGVCAAAVASADGPVSAAILLAVAAPFAFISLPGQDRAIERLLSELDELTTWSSE